MHVDVDMDMRENKKERRNIGGKDGGKERKKRQNPQNVRPLKRRAACETMRIISRQAM
jgi:hypothetical protein